VLAHNYAVFFCFNLFPPILSEITYTPIPLFLLYLSDTTMATIAEVIRIVNIMSDKVTRFAEANGLNSADLFTARAMTGFFLMKKMNPSQVEDRSYPFMHELVNI
jgi:hypothetical protein